MKYTRNFNFKKPEPLDTVNIEDINETFDLLDVELKKQKDNNDTMLVSERERILKEKERLINEENRVDEFLNIKKDYDTYKNVMIAESNVAALQNEINKNTSQLDTNTTRTDENKRGLNYYWLPPKQPPARVDKTGYFINAFELKPNETIANYFEPMRLANPGYITRNSLGKDTSNTYDIWKYEFTPKNPKKTILISTCLHGGEVTTVVSMIRFLNYLINDWEKYPELAYIRENVKIVYVPFANPWGVAQQPRTRQNSSGVDLNRNFDYKWSEFASQQNYVFGHDYKGTAPFSEKETQYIRDLMKAYPEAVCYVDMHNTGEPLYDVYVALPSNFGSKMYDKLANYFTRNKTSPNLHIVEDSNPGICNYGTNVLGIPTTNPEWNDRSVSTSLYDTDEITASTSWFSNVIIESCREFGVKESKPFAREYSYTFAGTQLLVSSATPTPISKFLDSFNIPSDGILIFEGSVTVSNDTTTSVQAFITPYLGQTGSIPSFNEYLSTRWENYASVATGSRETIPFYASMPVKKTNGVNVLVGGIGLVSNTGGTGSFEIKRYRGRVLFIPTKYENFNLKQIL